MKTKSYQEIISELLSENYKSSLENYGLPFQHELWHVKGYFGVRKISPEKIIALILVIEDIIKNNELYITSKVQSQDDEISILYQKRSETKYPDFCDILNLYFKWNKKEFFCKLKDEGFPDLKLLDVYGVIFLFSLSKIIFITKKLVTNEKSPYDSGVNEQSIFWSKVAAKSYQQFDYSIPWCHMELDQTFNSWTQGGSEFPKPKTFLSACIELSHHRFLLINQAYYQRKKGRKKTWEKSHKKSFDIAKKFYEENKNNSKYHNNKDKIIKAKFIKAIDNHLQEQVSDSEISQDTLGRWYKLFENNNQIEFGGVTTNKYISEIDKINKIAKKIGLFMGF